MALVCHQVVADNAVNQGEVRGLTGARMMPLPDNLAFQL